MKILCFQQSLFRLRRLPQELALTSTTETGAHSSCCWLTAAKHQHKIAKCGQVVVFFGWQKLLLFSATWPPIFKRRTGVVALFRCSHPYICRVHHLHHFAKESASASTGSVGMSAVMNTRLSWRAWVADLSKQANRDDDAMRTWTWWIDFQSWLVFTLTKQIQRQQSAIDNRGLTCVLVQVATLKSILFKHMMCSFKAMRQI